MSEAVSLMISPERLSSISWESLTEAALEWGAGEVGAQGDGLGVDNGVAYRRVHLARHNGGGYNSERVLGRR